MVQSKIFRLPYKVWLIYPVIAAGFVFIVLKITDAYQLSSEADQLSKAGFKKKSVSVYSRLSKNLIIDPNTYYQFAIALANLKKTDSAIILLDKSMQYLYNDQSATLMANLYYEKGLQNLADSFYRQAVFINPKSFRNRFDLFQFYVEMNKKSEAIYWGNSILNMPIKIASRTVVQIKKETYNLLNQINN